MFKIATIILLVFAFRSTFYEPFKIPSGSMIPTLLIGDYILVEKFTYGFKVPFTQEWSDPIYITEPSLPKRGQVIVFKYPKDESFNFIKRVIGLPGDTIEVINKRVFVNDKEVPKELIDGSVYEEDMDVEFRKWEYGFYEEKVGDVKHVLQLNKTGNSLANIPRIKVPEGQYFVMGDNRDHSSDSRAWGFVPFENIKGEAKMIWFSVSIPMFWDAPNVVFTFRPWRIGTIIN